MLKKNQTIEITINDLSSEGHGVGRIDGFTVFVEGGLPGEALEIQIVKLNKHYGFGKLLRILRPSPHRAAPPCPVYNRCGGCGLMHLDYEAQLRFKKDVVAQALKRLGGFEDIRVEDTLGMAEPFHYRNKGQFPCGSIDGEAMFGFFAPRSHRLIPLEHCMIQHPVHVVILSTVKDFMLEKNISPYDEETHKGLVRHVFFRTAFSTGETMAVIVINGDSLPYAKLLGERLLSIEGVCSVALNINKARTNVILGNKTQALAGKPSIREHLGHLKLDISPLSFFQINPAQTKVLYDKVIELGDLRETDTVLDAYCGIGSIGLYLAGKVKKVVGVEIIPEAIEDARRNAALNGIENAEFHIGKAEDLIPRFFKNGQADILILDPPRKGCEKSLLTAALSAGVKRLVYVSCNPSTLARDLKYICAGGEYTIQKVQPVDCFCHSKHVECVVEIAAKNYQPPYV